MKSYLEKQLEARLGEPVPRFFTTVSMTKPSVTSMFEQAPDGEERISTPGSMSATLEFDGKQAIGILPTEVCTSYFALACFAWTGTLSADLERICNEAIAAAWSACDDPRNPALQEQASRTLTTALAKLCPQGVRITSPAVLTPIVQDMPGTPPLYGVLHVGPEPKDGVPQGGLELFGVLSDVGGFSEQGIQHIGATARLGKKTCRVGITAYAAAMLLSQVAMENKAGRLQLTLGQLDALSTWHSTDNEDELETLTLHTALKVLKDLSFRCIPRIIKPPASKALVIDVQVGDHLEINGHPNAPPS
jgi:hypothetical protein